MELDLRPRFLPDRDLNREWPFEGRVLASWILKGLPVPPIACFARTASQTWMKLERDRLESLNEAFPGVKMTSVVETLWNLLAGRKDWPLQFRTSDTAIIVDEANPEKLLRALGELMAPVKAQGATELPVLVQAVVDVAQSQRGSWKVSTAGLSKILKSESGLDRVLSRLGIGKQAARKFFQAQFPNVDVGNAENQRTLVFAAEIAARVCASQLTQSETAFAIEWAWDREHFFLTGFRSIII
ncbi:MAG: hypothetical protein JNL01_15755 [Bdellovibrionales bacterium]|nr:hypothetical protein [Bdellovibrionales bacterium]